ncbi:asialoglycoprotein receptor 1-like [Mya arenaria]|uniref:asialoglycoprotein receptor 1-like n=1 Tax=Mya arenaria TaxID=6604 RepID=UPI0022E50DD4|nr:asialoglycoprotein receptor 1-like [Mya arenaria]
MENMFIIGFTLAILGNIHGVATEAITPCPDDWTAYEGSCYSFHSHNATFTEAEHYCQNHRAHLVHVNDDIENSFLRNEIQERSKIIFTR